MARPLVSVITPTWQRHDLLKECVENVESQTYAVPGQMEHVIVSDGPDSELRALVDYWNHPTKRVPIEFVECGRNWSSFLVDSYAAAPAIVGQLLERGEFQMLLSDDERMTPDHIASLVNLLEETAAGFAYSKTEMYHKDRPDERWIIGTDPPRYGQITNWLYRTELLKLGLYPFGDDRVSDWALISQWQSRGARHAFWPEVTLVHRADV